MSIVIKLNEVVTHLQTSLELLAEALAEALVEVREAPLSPLGESENPYEEITNLVNPGPVTANLQKVRVPPIAVLEEFSKNEWHQLFLEKAEEVKQRKGLENRLAGLLELRSIVDQAIAVVNRSIKAED